MKYIRTKFGPIIEFLDEDRETELPYRDLRFYFTRSDKVIAFIDKDEIIKQADTIEELCDEFVCQENDNFYWLASRENVSFRHLPNCYCKAIFGAIWTDRGLIYVAKMNEKGELELL